jgi:superfamily II RNA helicase
MTWPLYSRIPKEEVDSSVILDHFLDFVRERDLELYPAQEEAILEIYSGKNVILNTPTGSGKSLVATALHFNSIATGKRSIYTCPIKALVNEKFLALCRDFGPEQVGMITGDASVNPEAKILCCTAEILANQALRSGAKANIQDVIVDEFHYYSDRDRGVAWQIPLLTLPQTRFLLMSATLGDTSFFQTELTRLNRRETAIIQSFDRPVPLSYDYSEVPLHETVQKLVEKDKSPVYQVCFSQRECAEEAQNLLSTNYCNKEEKSIIVKQLEGTEFSSPYGKEIQKLLKHGVGLHHAGLLPKYRILVERLAQQGLLKIICGTDTLGVGVNIPIRTVLLTKLCKYNGEKVSILTVRDFRQISGRAGRKGYDNEGFVIAQAPQHIIENIRQEQKAAGDAKKLKKIVKQKPPEKGFVPWTQETFKKLISGEPEPLISRFKVSHAMLLLVLSRENEDGCSALRQLIRDSHETTLAKKQHRRLAFQLFRSLVERKIIELNPLRVNVDLQEDFSLNHALSLYLLDTLKLLDPEHPEYALDVLTLVESILENPDLILRKQLDLIKTEKMFEMKLEGIEYDERIAELEKLEYPKPRRDFIYSTFNEFSALHPWVGSENIRPKSVAREIYENCHTFAEYIREYQLHRIEGILLRYISDVYKVLVQTVPESAKNDELNAITLYLGAILKQVDSSLLEEWERIRNPIQVNESAKETKAPALPSLEDITSNKKAFTILVRNEVFRLQKAISARKYEAALEMLIPNPETNWSPKTLETTLAPYYEDHKKINLDATGRNPKNLTIKIDPEKQVWHLHLILVDPDEHNDWAITLNLKLVDSRQQLRPMMELLTIGPI